MSNPLLHPSDSRFQRPGIRDAAGKNPFADQNSAADASREAGDVYAAATADGAQPFTAQYPVQQTSRAPMLLFLGGIGWGAAAIGAISFTGWFDAGWVSPLLGLGFSGVAWLFAHQEFKAIRAGAIAADAEPQVRRAYWLGLTGIIACIGVVAAMICYEMRLLPGT